MYRYENVQSKNHSSPSPQIPTSILPLHRTPKTVFLLLRHRLFSHHIHIPLIGRFKIAPQRASRFTGRFERKQLEILIPSSPMADDPQYITPFEVRLTTCIRILQRADETRFRNRHCRLLVRRPRLVRPVLFVEIESFDRCIPLILIVRLPLGRSGTGVRLR